MDIEAFEFKVNECCKKNSVVFETQTVDTEALRISDLKESFCMIETLSKNWDRIELLLRQEPFKEKLREDKETVKQLGADFNDFICKIDVGVIGYLWCIGEQYDKANFLFNLTRINRKKQYSPRKSPYRRTTTNESEPEYNPKKDIIMWSNKNLKHIFIRLLEFSINLPFDLDQTFQEYGISDFEVIVQEYPELRQIV